jgi:hypothetical protein
LLVQTVNLRISQNVTYSLEINNHHITLSKLPSEVTQSLGYKTLSRILASCFCPPSIIIVLFILPRNEVLAIIVLEWRIFIQYLVDECVNEFNKVL